MSKTTMFQQKKTPEGSSPSSVILTVMQFISLIVQLGAGRQIY